MLDNIRILNFKCFAETSISLSNLTLFSGANSSGKSTAIQALMIALDNLNSPEGKIVKMKSTNSRIGSFNDTRSFITNAKEYKIELSAKDKSVNILFTPGDDSFLTTNIVVTGAPEVFKESIGEDGLLYLPANRQNSADTYDINVGQSENPLGNNGEFVIDYYHKHRSDIIADNLAVKGRGKTLENQVNYWLEKLTGYKLAVEFKGTSYTVNFVTPNDKLLRPYHVGTGISFIATLLIAGLATKEGNMIIIENPEIHLHPNAQADIIDFFCMLAKAGIQVIIESHSDHLFNGIRRSIAKENIDKDLTSVYFFKKDERSLSVPHKVGITEKGAVEEYIPGLFDQFDNDLDVLLGL